jgi:hypothetical protein
MSHLSRKVTAAMLALRDGRINALNGRPYSAKYWTIRVGMAKKKLTWVMPEPLAEIEQVIKHNQVCIIASGTGTGIEMRAKGYKVSAACLTQSPDVEVHSSRPG